MELSNSAARIDLICPADARHLVRSLQQALALHGLQVTLRDLSERPKAPIGVAVLTPDGPDVQTWQARLAGYASSSRLAFEAALAPVASDVFVLAGWPSRRADRVLSDLAEHLMREVAANPDPAPRARRRRESTPALALFLVLGVLGGLLYLLVTSSGADPAGSLAESERPEEVISRAAVSAPVADGSASPVDILTVPTGALDKQTTTAAAAADDSSSSMSGVAVQQASVSCTLRELGPMPAAWLFAWRPLVRGPERPRIWAQVQPQYYLPDHCH